MARSVAEWRGKTDDTPVPPRVRLRVLDRDGHRCQCGCGRPIAAGDKWETDHKVAIINGGANREANLHSLLTVCHLRKTVADVAEKAAVDKIAKKHAGIATKSRRPIAGRGFQRSERMKDKTPKADALRAMREQSAPRIGAFKVEKPDTFGRPKWKAELGRHKAKAKGRGKR